jgi:hypothetical protein
VLTAPDGAGRRSEAGSPRTRPGRRGPEVPPRPDLSLRAHASDTQTQLVFGRLALLVLVLVTTSP